MTGLPAPSPAGSATDTPASLPPALEPHRAALTTYADLLATVGVERGLIGPREAPRLWERHLLNSAGIAELLEPGWSIVDLGSGAGLPGLVVAIARPDLAVTLVEPLLRRATFLEEARTALALDHVVVRRARAEELAGELVADAVVARAVAPLDRLAGWALPLLRPDGVLLAVKGASAVEEVARTAAAVDRAGGAPAEVRTVGDQSAGTAATVVVVRRTGSPAPQRTGPASRTRSGTSSRRRAAR